MSDSSSHAAEIRSGKRFGFGKNWRRFLSTMNEKRLRFAVESLQKMLGAADLAGKSFLDIGSGSGLFSLAARRMGARVHSFDYDPNSVACTEELKKRYYEGDPNWTIEHGSALDGDYLAKLGKFDIVYSWGVLHHTGMMWAALDNAAPLVAPGGKLFVAIYNDQGMASRFWTAVKKLYNRVCEPFKTLMVASVWAFWEGRAALARALRFENPLPFKAWKELSNQRGMSVWHDMVDWVGGYPFEVARPEQIFDFYRDRGFVLLKMKTCAGSHGCNEFVFKNAGRDAVDRLSSL